MTLIAQSSWTKAFNRLEEVLQSFWQSLPSLILAILTFYAFFLLSKWVRKKSYLFFRDRIKDRQIRNFTSQVISGLVILIGFILALEVLDLEKIVQSVLTGVGIAGLGLTLATQDILVNRYSGLYLEIEDIIRKGDTVEVNGIIGEVIEIGDRNTRIKEASNHVLILPNKVLLENQIINWSSKPTTYVNLKGSISYDSDLDKVEEVIVETLEETFNYKKNDKPKFRFDSLGDSAIQYSVWFTKGSKKELNEAETRSLAIKKIIPALRANKIEVGYPVQIGYENTRKTYHHE